MSGILGLILSDSFEITTAAAELCRDTISRTLSQTAPSNTLAATPVSVWREEGCFLGAWKAATLSDDESLISTDEVRRFQVVGSGGIINSREIHKTLTLRGHHFASNNGFECLAHLAQEGHLDWELGLDGKFAFAIWDRHERILHLGRDRFGLKPLFWIGNSSGFAFSSSLTQLKAVLLELERQEDGLGGAVRRFFSPSNWTLSRQSLRWLLDTACIPAPETIFSQVNALPPGHRLLWSPGQPPKQQAWWRLTYSPQRTLAPRQAEEDFSDIFHESLQAHASQMKPVRLCLDSHVDSVLLAAHASRLASGALATCSLSFDPDEVNGIQPESRIAHLLGAEHHPHHCTVCPVDEIFPMVRSFEQPFGNPEVWHHWLLAQASSESSPGLLTADGADFLWGRGSSFPLNHLFRLFPRISGKPARRSPGKSLCGTTFSWQDLFLEPMTLLRQHRQIDPDGLFWNSLLKPDCRNASCLIPASSAPEAGKYEAMLAMDADYFLPHDLSARIDSIASAWRVSFQHPWLGNRLFEFVNHLPIRHKINGGITHWLAHQALQASWPAIAAITRQPGGKRSGVPIQRWLARDLSPIFRDGPLGLDSPLREMIDQKPLRILFEQHRTGLTDRSKPLWLVLVVDLWLREKKLAV